MRRINILIVLALMGAITLSSCGRQKTGTTESTGTKTQVTALQPVDTKDAVPGDWIVKQEMADAEKLMPTVTNDASATDVFELIYDALLKLNRETYELEGNIAKGPPVISDDHLTYTFDLKENVTFSDGKPLTGEDIIFTLKTIKVPFVDAQALRNYFDDTKSVELVDGNKYKIKFTQSKPYFRAIYSLGDMRITPKHILDPNNVTDKFTWELLAEAQKSLDAKKYPDMQKFADFFNSQEVARDPKFVIGSGPYKLEKWQTGQAITLAKNENYWDKANTPNFANKIVFKIIQDQNAAVVAAKNKEVDYMFVIQPADFFENVKNPEQFNIKKALVLEPVYVYIAWNNERPLFKDKKVRMALSYAVDRQSIIDKLLFSSAVPVSSHIFYKSKFINDKLPSIPYDLEKAKQLLDEAGWKDTDGDGIRDKIVDGKKMDFKFTFMNNNNPKRKKVMLVVIESLKQIGIAADLQEYEWSVFLDKIKKHDFDACYASWQLNVTPDDPYQIWHSSQASGEGSNHISYKNPEADKLLEENRITFDDAKRKEILDKWQQIVFDDQPVTFMWSETSRYFYSDRFRNTRWYSYPSSGLLNEWWTPKNMQRYQ
jgi:peptide/nickel transport system substrate-binding protein